MRRLNIRALALGSIGIVVVALIAAGGFTLVPRAAGQSSQVIGYVNVNKIFAEYPDFQKGMAALQKELQAMQKELDAKVEGLDTNSKVKMRDEYQARLDKRKAEVLGPLEKKVNQAIEDVAKASGVSVVLSNQAVIYGGKDLTDEVIKRLGGSKK
ncbi:MAG TPA: OmpH family outer membrane protein [Firmicutes bacterium]|nr:OmpH family outer membrane protein [Bacillota bacterium]